MIRFIHLGLIAALAFGCGDDSAVMDSGADGGMLDAARPDSSTPDGSTPDSSTPDSSTPDGATPDGATPDGATPDGAMPDSSTPDAGPGDTGPDVCIPATLTEACADMGRDCGAVDDGCGVSLDCGSCTAPETCGGSATDNVCGCTPFTIPEACADMGLDCGDVDDGCGATVDCGACTAPATCGGGGVPNTCAAPLAPAAGEVIVSEVFYDPDAVGDLSGEWLELHNTTASNLELDGCELTDDEGDLHVIDNGGSLSIPAGGYIVLGITTDLAANGGAPVDYAWGSEPGGLSSFPLSNRDDQVILTCDAVEIDRMAWDERGTPEWPDLRGASLTLSPTMLDSTGNDLRTSWCGATTTFGDGDNGTPGAANDACPEPIATCTMTMEAGMCPDSVFACSTDMAGGDGCLSEGLANCYESGAQAYRVDDTTAPLTIVFNGTVSTIDLFFSIADTGDFGEIRFYDEADDLVGRLVANGPCATGPMPAVQSLDLDAPAVRAEVTVPIGVVYLDSFTLNPR